MDGDLYDEFGNYIGPELSASEQARIFVNDLRPIAKCWRGLHIFSFFDKF
jgi:hypothetical protein